MLKITVAPEAQEIRLKLEGDLAGTWVRELEESWRSIRDSRRDRKACLDLTDVARVDDAGRYLLALIHESGARMISSGVATRDLLESIARDWPAIRIERPGRGAVPAPRAAGT